MPCFNFESAAITAFTIERSREWRIAKNCVIGKENSSFVRVDVPEGKDARSVSDCWGFKMSFNGL